MNRLQRSIYKVQQVGSFFTNTRTPLQLTLDALKLKKRKFVAVSREGLRLALEPRRGESFTFYENLICRHYLLNGITLRPRDTVVDIGGNIGSFAVLAASIVGPSGRVVSIEPASATFARLKENVALNDLANVACVQGAIDANPGTLTLHIDPKSALSSAFGVNATEGGQYETVQSFTLGQILEQEKIDWVHLLKVDCEGAEYGIFDSLSPELARRIDQISMEVHPVVGRKFGDIEKRLKELGFEVRTYPKLPWVAFNKILQGRIADVNSIDSTRIIQTLDAYCRRWPEQREYVGDLRKLLEAGADCVSRKEFRGHVTCSAMVVDENQNVLMIHHRTLDRWLMPGGHVQKGDPSLVAAAMRELAEEAGAELGKISVDSKWGEVPVWIDRHSIPANPRKGEPEHEHWDFCFVLEYRGEVVVRGNEEVKEVRWIGMGELPGRFGEVVEAWRKFRK